MNKYTVFLTFERTSDGVYCERLFSTWKPIAWLFIKIAAIATFAPKKGCTGIGMTPKSRYDESLNAHIERMKDLGIEP